MAGEEPTFIYAGTRFQWEKVLGDFSSDDGWVLTYRLTDRTNAKITIVANGSNTSGTTHHVDIGKSTSNGYTAGDYDWSALVSVSANGDSRFIDRGVITIEADPAQVTTLDQRSHVKKVLDAIESILEGKTADVQDYTVSTGTGSRQISKMNIQELREWRNEYRRLYADEMHAEDIRKGLGNRRKIKSQFVAP